MPDSNCRSPASLFKRYEEVIQLCETFKARAYIHIQKQNHRDVSLSMISEIVNRIQCGQMNQKNVFDSVVFTKEQYNEVLSIRQKINKNDGSLVIILTYYFIFLSFVAIISMRIFN